MPGYLSNSLNTTIDLKQYLGTIKDLSSINSSKLSHIVMKSGVNPVGKPITTPGTKGKKKLTASDVVKAQLDLNREPTSNKLAKNLLQCRR